MAQVFDDGVSPARIKANQCYTKYKWRDAEAASQAGGPEIVATQVRPWVWLRCTGTDLGLKLLWQVEMPLSNAICLWSVEDTC